MIDENQSVNDAEETHEQPQPDRDESLLPARIPGKPFSKDNQPSSESKKAGWLKKKRNKELAQYLLGRAWRKNKQGDDFTKQMFEFFDISPEEADELTYEAVIMLKQIAQAIKLGDNTSAQIMFERAFGKPMQTISIDDDGTPPQINITIQQVDGVKISQSEMEVDADMPEIKNNNENTQQ